MWRGGFRFEHICSRLFRLAVPYEEIEQKNLIARKCGYGLLMASNPVCHGWHMKRY
jgi:hypothetical protein